MAGKGGRRGGRRVQGRAVIYFYSRFYLRFIDTSIIIFASESRVSMLKRTPIPENATLRLVDFVACTQHPPRYPSHLALVAPVTSAAGSHLPRRWKKRRQFAVRRWDTPRSGGGILREMMDILTNELGRNRGTESQVTGDNAEKSPQGRRSRGWLESPPAQSDATAGLNCT